MLSCLGGLSIYIRNVVRGLGGVSGVGMDYKLSSLLHFKGPYTSSFFPLNIGWNSDLPPPAIPPFRSKPQLI